MAKNILPEKKSLRRGRFEKVAARRVQKIIDFLDSLSNCANRSNYDYTEDDVKKMFKAIRDKVSQSESSFDKQLDKGGRNSFKF
jgi:hypothetical protein